MAWTLSRVRRSGPEPLDDLVLAWSNDGARAVLARSSGEAFRPGAWSLALTLSLDVGAERAARRRNGSSAPETGALEFDRH